jgi:DNA repair photolyase
MDEVGINLLLKENAGISAYSDGYDHRRLVKSVELGMAFSINPQQFCQHRCVYCWARNSD